MANLAGSSYGAGDWQHNMKWFLNLNAALKLILSSAVLLSVTTALGIQGLVNTSEMNQRLRLMYSRNFEGMLATKTLEVAKMEAARSTRNAILKIPDNAAIDKEEKGLDALMKIIKDDLAVADQSAYRPEMKRQFGVVRGILPEYESRARDVFKQARSGDVKAAKASLQANGPVIKELNTAVREASAIQKAVADEEMAANQRLYERVRKSMLILLFSAIVLGIGLSLWIARLFSRPLSKTVAILDGIARGDFTKKLDVDSHDEVGRMAAALNRAITNISQILLEVDGASLNVGTASQDLAAASEKIASAVTEQAASLNETAASLEEITATVRQNADSANYASEIAATCSQRAQDGDGSVSAAVGAMSHISKSSVQIANIIAVIDELAFKTNLLAVNAAIEAARAGDHGLGFAVVSTEIRSLAKSCADSAREINAHVTDSMERIGSGSELVNQSGVTLRETAELVKTVNRTVSEIAVASREQLIGVEQVSIAMSQIDQAVHLNSTQTEELSVTAGKLASEAAHLRQLVSRFTVARA